SRIPVATSEVGSRFGNRIDPIRGGLAFHNGLDFPAEPGSNIRASAGGKVITAGYHGELGNMVEIQHEGGLVTRYGHASQLLVRAGDFVAPGQPIARVGSTGRSTGPHLHFEIVDRGRHLDPERFLRGVLRVGG
ncbi:MAG: M23 family metallopeptidase, partial [Zoogloea sp.]|nr:M23 family metallopeptidase [Zoogloea sp.]